MSPNCNACARLKRDKLERSRALLRCLEVMLPMLTEDAAELEAALTLVLEIDAQLAGVR
jgi:hypothetical protein